MGHVVLPDLPSDIPTGTVISTGVPISLLVLQKLATDMSTCTPIPACVPIGLKVLQNISTNMPTFKQVLLYKKAGQ